MSFRCEGCKEHHPGRPVEKVVAERKVIYELGKTGKKHEEEKTSYGREPVTIKKLCPRCVQTHPDKGPLTLPKPKRLLLSPARKPHGLPRPFRPMMAGRLSKTDVRTLKAAY